MLFSLILFAMSKGRAYFTADVVTILFGILPDHVSPVGGKIDWDVVASTLNTRIGRNYTSLSVKNWFANMKDIHKAWNELKKWTGIGWTKNGCLEVDEKSEKWQAFLKDCGGTIDSTLIHAAVADTIGKAFRDRHGDKSWNVMVVCSLNMLFTHINVGYERECT